MLPLVDKPIIQYVSRRRWRRDRSIVIVTGRGKTAIENHFDVAYDWSSSSNGAPSSTS